MLRVERQEALGELQEKKHDEARGVEEEKSAGILFPGHLPADLYAAETIDGAFHRTGDAAQRIPPPLEDRRHVAAEKRREDEQHREVEYN